MPQSPQIHCPRFTRSSTTEYCKTNLLWSSPCINYSAPVWPVKERSTVLWWECLWVCPSASMSQEPHVQTSLNFLCMLPVAKARSFCGDIATFWFSCCRPSAIFDFQNLKFLVVASWVGGVNMRHRTKFYQNQSNILLTILPNKTAKLLKQSWLQFLLVLKSTAIKQQKSKILSA